MKQTRIENFTRNGCKDNHYYALVIKQSLYYFSDMFPESFESIISDNEPKLQGSEALAQRNLPMLRKGKKERSRKNFVPHSRNLWESVPRFPILDGTNNS